MPRFAVVILRLGWAFEASDVALFLPFRCNKERQPPASDGTRRNHKIAIFCVGGRTVPQNPANLRKGRLTLPFRLLTGGLMVRIQPEESHSLGISRFPHRPPSHADSKEFPQGFRSAGPAAPGSTE